jgi:hypothetical protein
VHRPPFVIIGMEEWTPAMGCSTIADARPAILLTGKVFHK